MGGGLSERLHSNTMQQRMMEWAPPPEYSIRSLCQVKKSNATKPVVGRSMTLQDVAIPDSCYMLDDQKKMNQAIADGSLAIFKDIMSESTYIATSNSAWIAP